MTDYDEWLERPYQNAERDAEREDGDEEEEVGPDPDDVRDQLRERRWMEEEEERGKVHRQGPGSGG